MTPQTIWAPDLPDFDRAARGHVYDVTNVLAGPNGFLPFRKFATFSDALPADCLGGTSARLADGTLAIFAATATHIYRLDPSDFSWDDVSGATYTASVEAPWSFIVFGQHVVAVNQNDAPQNFEVGTDSTFSDLSANAPQGGWVGVWGDQLVIADQTDNPTQISWSDIDDHETWTGGNSGSQTFPDGGRVVGATLSDTGLILQERAVRRYQFTGDANIYIFDKIGDEIGSRYPRSVVARDEFIFWLGEDGFYMGSLATGPVSIGHNAVNRWFQSDIGIVGNSVASIDPAYPRVTWAYGSTTPNVYDTVLTYDWRLQRWSKAEAELTTIFPYQTPGTTLEGLDDISSSLDALGVSLDSRQFQGGALLLAGFGTDRKLGSFSGDNAAATIVSDEMQPAEGRRGRVRWVRPVVDVETQSDVTATVTSRKRRGDAFTSKGPVEANESGWCSINKSGGFHRVQVDIAEGAAWENYQGIEIDYAAEGKW